MRRVMVFVDYLNFCQGAQEMLGPSTGPRLVNPARLAQAVVADGPPERALAGTRVYRGVPDYRRDPDAYVLAFRQMDGWRDAGISVVHQPLARSGSAPASSADVSADQKSLAVRLALDLVVLAWRDQFDIAVLLSLDADLTPALKAVLDHTWKSVEVASWRNPCGPSPRLAVRGERLRCHWLDAATFTEASPPGGRRQA